MTTGTAFGTLPSRQEKTQLHTSDGRIVASPSKATSHLKGEVLKRTILLAIVMSLVLPTLAAAKIVVDRSMFGITLGASPAQVHAKLGKPTNIVYVTGTMEWVYAARHAVVMFAEKDPVVSGLFTQSRAERTAKGIGVGSTRRQVERSIRGVSCTAHGCLVFAQHGAKTYGTDFALDSAGRVTSILVNQFS